MVNCEVKRGAEDHVPWRPQHVNFLLKKMTHDDDDGEYVSSEKKFGTHWTYTIALTVTIYVYCHRRRHHCVRQYVKK